MPSDMKNTPCVFLNFIITPNILKKEKNIRPEIKQKLINLFFFTKGAHTVNRKNKRFAAGLELYKFDFYLNF